MDLKKWVVALSALALALATPLAASAGAAKAATGQHVYYGNISDSMCGAKHMMAGDPHKCTLACVKGGAKYVLVTGGRVVKIANQNFSGLGQYAGEHVKVTGARSGGSITIAHIAPVIPRKRK
jgi:type 1 fimbria pilin